jgi:hypothetical protein
MTNTILSIVKRRQISQVPLTKPAIRDWIILKIRELDSEGQNQSEIATQLKCSQQLVSYYLKKIREQDRIQLERGHEELAYTYRVVLDNLRKIRRELWQDLRQTTDKRTKASFMQTLIDVNLRLIELATSNDIVLATVKNAEKIALEAEKDLKKARTTAKVSTSAQEAEQVVEGLEVEEDVKIELNDNSDAILIGAPAAEGSSNDDSSSVVVTADPNILIEKYNQMKHKGRRRSSSTTAVSGNGEEEGASVTSTTNTTDDNDVQEEEDTNDVIVEGTSSSSTMYMYGGNGACICYSSSVISDGS